MFDEPTNYHAKVKARYEVMYRQLCKNQVTLVTKNKKLSSKKDVWFGKVTQAEKMIQNLQGHKREKVANYHEELQKAHHQTRNFKEKCQSLKEYATKKDQENLLLQSSLQSLNQQLAIQHDEIQQLI